jgi:hypothetical protein
MKPGVKDVIHEDKTVTVVYENGGVSKQTFTDAEQALVYCSGFGRHPAKKAVAPKKPAPKPAKKKPAKKST